MKTFFKQVLAVVVGMLIVSAFTFLMGFIMLGAMLSAGDSKPVIKNGSVLRIDLSGNLQERVQENPVSAFLGMSGTEEQGLDNILKSIKIAATNDKISGIYLESGIFSADMASLEEIRKALTDFKKSGKFIIAYGDSYLQGAFPSKCRKGNPEQLLQPVCDVYQWEPDWKAAEKRHFHFAVAEAVFPL